MKLISARKIEYVQKKHIEAIENTDEFQSLAASLFLLLNDVSDTFSACKTAPEFQSRFFTFLEKYGVLKSESLVSNEENGRSLLRLKELFDQLSSIWAGQLQDFSVDTFLTDFIEELKGENFQLREVKGVGIQIMPMLEARAENPDVLFIAGLNQSAFPKSLSQPVIFNQHEREALKLLTPDFSIQEDQYVLDLLLAKDCTCYVSDHAFESNVDGRSLLLHSALDSCTQYAWPKPNITLGKRYEKRLSAEFSENEFHALGLGSLADVSFRKKMESHVYSASQIERYVACPYRYFVEDVLAAKEEKGVELDQTPAEFGTLLHHILFRLYTECPSIRTAPISSRLEKIKAVLEDEVAQNNVEALRISIAHINDILEEDAKIAGEFEPRFFEWRFGYSSKESEDEHSTNRVLKLSQNGREAQFQGQIDRVDLNESNQAIIIDYKSSSKLTISSIIKGESFQLLLYILAATDLLQDVHEVETAFIFTVANSKKIGKNALLGNLEPYNKKTTKYKNDLGEDVTFEDFLEVSKERILTITERIISGKFPLRPADISQKLESCAYCPAKAVCRIREKLMHYPEEIRNLS
jgi:ATP-dependent helicase/DNAse subunit B